MTLRSCRRSSTTWLAILLSPAWLSSALLSSGLLSSGLLSSGCAMGEPTAIVLELDTDHPAISATAVSAEIEVSSGEDGEFVERVILDSVLLPEEILLVPSDTQAVHRSVGVDITLYDGPSATGFEVSRRRFVTRYTEGEVSSVLVAFE